MRVLPQADQTGSRRRAETRPVVQSASLSSRRITVTTSNRYCFVLYFEHEEREINFGNRKTQTDDVEQARPGLEIVGALTRPRRDRSYCYVIILKRRRYHLTARMLHTPASRIFIYSTRQMEREFWRRTPSYEVRQTWKHRAVKNSLLTPCAQTQRQ